MAGFVDVGMGVVSFEAWVSGICVDLDGSPGDLSFDDDIGIFEVSDEPAAQITAVILLVGNLGLISRGFDKRHITKLK